MRSVIRFVKKIFGIYESGYEYWVYTKDIKIDPKWRQTPIGKAKFSQKVQYWYCTGKFESKILLDKNFNLIDGYSSFCIAETHGIDKVPVYFIHQ